MLRTYSYILIECHFDTGGDESEKCLTVVPHRDAWPSALYAAAMTLRLEWQIRIVFSLSSLLLQRRPLLLHP